MRSGSGTRTGAASLFAFVLHPVTTAALSAFVDASSYVRYWFELGRLRKPDKRRPRRHASHGYTLGSGRPRVAPSHRTGGADDLIAGSGKRVQRDPARAKVSGAGRRWRARRRGRRGIDRRRGVARRRGAPGGPGGGGGGGVARRRGWRIAVGGSRRVVAAAGRINRVGGRHSPPRGCPCCPCIACRHCRSDAALRSPSFWLAPIPAETTSTTANPGPDGRATAAARCCANHGTDSSAGDRAQHCRVGLRAG